MRLGYYRSAAVLCSRSWMGDSMIYTHRYARLFLETALVIQASAWGSTMRPSSENRRDPEAVVSHALDALGRLDWNAFAGYVDPESLEELKVQSLPFFLDVIARRKNGTLADEELVWAQSLRDLDSQGDLEALPSRFFLVSLLEAARPTLSIRAYRVLGSTPQEKDLSYVRYETVVSSQGYSKSYVSLVAVTKRSGGWRLILSGDLLGQGRAVWSVGH